MAYQDRQRALAERRAGERQEATARLRRGLAVLVLGVGMIWGIRAYPLLHEGSGLLRVAGATGLVGIIMTFAYLGQTGELRSRRLKRPSRMALLAVVVLGGGLLGAVVGIAGFHIGNGMFDRGPVTTTAYDVVSPPTLRRCGRRGCDVGLRSRDARNDSVRLRVRGRVFQIDWRAVIVEIDTKPGRFHSRWIVAYRYVRTSAPAPPLRIPQGTR